MNTARAVGRSRPSAISGPQVRLVILPAVPEKTSFDPDRLAAKEPEPMRAGVGHWREKQGTGRVPLRFVVLDELNKYAPAKGFSPLRELLVDIAERGRSLARERERTETIMANLGAMSGAEGGL